MELLLFNKPFEVLCQFTDAETTAKSPAGRKTLADFINRPGYYPAGRLDYNSEGLLILTDNGAMQQRIASPANKMQKSYWVQVEGTPSPQALTQLSEGVLLKDGKTLPAQVKLLAEAPTVWTRQPCVAQHRECNSRWLDIAITEGKNRQVRRMCAAVGHPVLRLIRHRIGPWRVDDIAPGQYRVASINLPKQTPAGANKRTTRRKSKHNRKPIAR